jgi:8-oxo-dGTP diphosphatase
MTDTGQQVIVTGDWGESVVWELYGTDVPPPTELTTAVMCVAIVNGKIVLARSERGWGMLGGHIEDSETPEDALRREALEEGGFLVDQHQLFAVRKVTSRVPMPHQQPGKNYPFPTSYLVYYWATTKQLLQPLTGTEILESRSFALEEIAALGVPDQPVIEAGWRAYEARQTSTVQ